MPLQPLNIVGKVCFLTFSLFSPHPFPSACTPSPPLTVVFLFSFIPSLALLVTEKSTVQWHTLNVHRPFIKNYILQYVRKGTRLLINGRLEYRNITRDEVMTKLAVVVVGESMRCTYTCVYRYKILYVCI